MYSLTGMSFDSFIIALLFVIKVFMINYKSVSNSVESAQM